MELEDVKEMVDRQAEDEGIWFMAETAPELYLQDKLRELHKAIEMCEIPKTERK